MDALVPAGPTPLGMPSVGPGTKFAPKPVQKPHMPIWMGGDAEAVLKRTARFASGWWPSASITNPSRWATAGSFSTSSTRLSSRARNCGSSGRMVSAARSMPPMLAA